MGGSPVPRQHWEGGGPPLSPGYSCGWATTEGGRVAVWGGEGCALDLLQRRRSLPHTRDASSRLVLFVGSSSYVGDGCAEAAGAAASEQVSTTGSAGVGWVKPKGRGSYQRTGE